MAGVDYRYCDVCGSRAFYDASLNWNTEPINPTMVQRPQKTVLENEGLFCDFLGSWKVLCTDCVETHEIVIKPKDSK